MTLRSRVEALDPRVRLRILAAAIFVLAGLAYAPAVTHGGFIWDDDAYVTDNWTLPADDGLKHIWFDVTATPQYYPLVHTTYWIEYRLWGLSPTGYHLVNVLLHALGAVLLWRALRWIELPGAWLAAAVFAVHPVGVESVAWITERKNVLSGALYFSALFAYLRFAFPKEGRPAWGWYGLALSAFVLALLAKTVTCSLPAVLLLILYWKRPRLTARDVAPLLPLFLVGAGLGLLTAYLERHHVGAEFDLSLTERTLIAGRAVWFYAGKVVWPTELAFIYPRPQLDASSWGQYLFPAAALVALAIAFVLRGRIGRGPLVALLAFGGTLFPALGFIDVYPFTFSFVADHFQYLASAALIGLLIGAAARATERTPIAARVGLAALLLATLSTLTWRQTFAYQDHETLWRDTLAKNPEAWIAHNHLGNLLLGRELYDEAIRHYDECLRIKPDHARAYGNKGAALYALGDADGALRMWETALDLQPDDALTLDNMGQLLLLRDRVDEAIAALERAVELEPELVAPRLHFAQALERAGRGDEAKRQRQEAARRRQARQKQAVKRL